MKKTFVLLIMASTALLVNAQEITLGIWSFETKGKVMSHPISDESNIYFGSTDSLFYSVDKQSGKKSWSFKTNAAIYSKALLNNQIVYFKSGNDVFALDKGSGKKIWAITGEDETGATNIDLWDYHSGAPAIHRSTIYFGFGNGKLLGFDLLTGEIKNEILSADSSAIKSGLIIENSILYFGDWDGRIYAYNLDTGEQLWVFKTYEKRLYPTFGQINTQLSIHKDLLFFGGRNPEMYVLDKNTGKKKWSYIEEAGGWISGDPLLLNDTLFIGGSDNHEMFAFNAYTGERYWSYLFLNNNFSTPMAYKNYLLFTTGDAYNVYGISPGRGYVYALNRSDGSIKNFAKIGGNAYTDVLVDKDILYLGSEDGNLYALDLEVFLNEKSNLKTKAYNAFDILDVSPLPFSDAVKISYEVAYKTNISIKINDLNEDEIIELYAGKIKPGEHFIMWDGKDAKMEVVEDGYYFFEISSGEYYKKAIIHKQVSEQ